MMNAIGVICAAALIFMPARFGVVTDDGRGWTAGQAAVAPVEGTWTSDARSDWSDAPGERRWQFNLRNDRGDSHWGFGIPPSEIEGVPAAVLDGTAGDVRFSWTREAGRFRFTGSFDRGRGSGRYVFTPAPAYLTAMQGLGYRLDGADAMRFAVLDVTTAYVRELAAVGYPTLPLDELTRMRIHRVSAPQIQEMKALGFEGLSTEMLVRLRIHKVTPEFVRGLSTRGYKGLLAEDLIRMRIHRVTLEEIDELKTLGFGGLGADELVRFRIHKVTPAFIREMRGVGFAGVTEEQLVRMRIHRVDAQFVRDARADGYALETPGDAVDLAIRGPRFTRARRK